jgi:hypothetical protein
VVLADREFCSAHLANWLREQKVYFCLRPQKYAFIEQELEIWIQLRDLGLAPGVSFFYQIMLRNVNSLKALTSDQ